MKKSAHLIGGIPVGMTACPIMNGAGIIKTPADLKRILKNDDLAIVEGGAFTVPARGRNPNNTLYIDEQKRFSVNSFGMDNLGAEEYGGGILHYMVELAHSCGKKFIANLAPVNSPEELGELLEMTIKRTYADGAVLNVGCPNIWDKDKPHPPISLDPPGLDATLALINKRFHGDIPRPVWIKLSPLIKDHSVLRVIEPGKPLPKFELDMELVKAVAEVIKKYPWIKAVVCTNTVGQVKSVDENGTPHIGPNPNNPNSTGGLAGRVIHTVSVQQARAFVGLLEGTGIDVIGAGGVENGQTMNDFMEVGCVAVQAVTPYYASNEDPGVYSSIAESYFLHHQAKVGMI